MSDFTDDKTFWLAIRAALLLFVDAIERRYHIGKHAANTYVRIANSDTVASAEYKE